MTDTNVGGMFSKLLDPSKENRKAALKKEDTQNKVDVSPTLKKESKKQDTAPLIAHKEKVDGEVKQPAGFSGTKRDTPIKEKKRKVGAYFTKSERQNLKDLDYKLNRRDNVIGQSEIMALGVETLYKMLNSTNMRFTTVEKLREYIDGVLTSAKKT